MYRQRRRYATPYVARAGTPLLFATPQCSFDTQSVLIFENGFRYMNYRSARPRELSSRHPEHSREQSPVQHTARSRDRERRRRDGAPRDARLVGSLEARLSSRLSPGAASCARAARGTNQPLDDYFRAFTKYTSDLIKVNPLSEIRSGRPETARQAEPPARRGTVAGAAARRRRRG